LHDGAVIIRNLRIAKAGVFFPMPDTKVLDKSLGSRHRAGLGITEETDAVVVVVSEERGSISFCFNGNIVTNLDGASLRQALLGLFGQRGRKRGKPGQKRGGMVTQTATGSFRIAPPPSEGRGTRAGDQALPSTVAPETVGSVALAPAEPKLEAVTAAVSEPPKHAPRPMTPARPIETPKPTPVPTGPPARPRED
jgi:hypothetical protein